MNEANKNRTIYSVSSKRMYSGGEDYFGTDGIFRTHEEAMAYIYRDIYAVNEVRRHSTLKKED